MTRFVLIFSLLAGAVMTGVWAWAVTRADAASSARWTIGPGADLTGAQALNLLAALPVLAIAVALLIALLARLEPFAGNLQLSVRAFLIATIGVQVLLVGASWILAEALTGPETSLVGWRALVAGACALLAALGDALPKTRRNFLLGVRTPWTLTSDLAWEKTHRLAGRLFVAIGLWGAIASFLFAPRPLVIAIAAPALSAAIVCIAYSYLVWRADPARPRGDIQHD